MSKRIDLTGMKFNHLTVLSFYDKKNGSLRWLCECDCEKKTKIIAYGHHLKSENIKSCGCLKVTRAIEQSKLNKKYNLYDLTGDYGIGYTSKGEKFYFDLEDYDLIKDYCWYISKDGYVVRRGQKGLHTMVMKVNKGQYVDHIHHNKRDNRKSELRICTLQKNSMNKKRLKNNTSGVTGVYWNKKNKNWYASIKVKGKSIYLGSYDNFEDAVKARKNGEEKYFGEFSYDNSMKEVVL